MKITILFVYPPLFYKKVIIAFIIAIFLRRIFSNISIGNGSKYNHIKNMQSSI
jgi:hypothetical protein